MATYNVSWVEQVNAAGNECVLTLDELWQGCLLLARSPQIFTSAISKCELDADDGNNITRTLYFSEGPQTELKQSVSLSPGTKFECESETGNRVTTMVFRGLSGSIDDAYLSIEYAIPIANMGPDLESAKQSYAAKAKQNLVEGVKTMRELKAQGKLG
ncbi:uncharacterized protein N7496_003863 [Penicillium cataractarum]|uniref:Uncharacterized protein n=1 Tax=Penicillium cataractarum TaxID=2100454 RepID=A0A9W9SNW1_9EURO|nr:uncharacterized protein N7496_003863 [Penicillium cataractarum]KAJ5381435.1 hypothetical protein N7496_003863 [Penicillium cataractarum]